MEYVECNVGDKTAVDAAIAHCAQHGRIDVLANVAGIVQFGRFEGITEAEYDRVQAVDLKGPFFLMQAALPHLTRVWRQHRQRLLGGRQQDPALLRGVLRGQGRAHHAHQGVGPRAGPGPGIRVNAVCPGTVDTPLVDGVVGRSSPPTSTRGSSTG